ncbi:MAG TPA: bifunctional 5,10-methylenetetrahydrofolate dehydrogenase/5,10-methenyltetrahydrofolate cyclohydrolase [Gemmatimonadota bacterium]|nr:bifunctional 5,10-methylenetetrahydrofolate dehydrogenase/5,10-methenyltetrahydrofolate cyclohydrolase [Gemmatimonadota bacterium]
MSARLIDGRAVGLGVRREVAEAVERLRAETGVVPGLAAVLVGDDTASATYVRMKGKACEEAGFHSRTVRRPASISEAELLELIAELNGDPAVHGILVQLPLPAQIDTRRVLIAVDPGKDVDGFHPVNVGRLTAGDFESGFVPATPAGIMRLVAETGIQQEGAEAVVIGRSDIVGKPTALLLLHAHATVTICHSRTVDLAAHARRADILVAAVGRPGVVTREMVKPGAVVIDVGMNRVDDPTGERGYRLVGDVDPGVAEVAGWLTPVPGGVGPMTIAMLLDNTLKAARRIVEAPVRETAERSR